MPILDYKPHSDYKFININDKSMFSAFFMLYNNQIFTKTRRYSKHTIL